MVLSIHCPVLVILEYTALKVYFLYRCLVVRVSWESFVIVCKNSAIFVCSKVPATPWDELQKDVMRGLRFGCSLLQSNGTLVNVPPRRRSLHIIEVENGKMPSSGFLLQLFIPIRELP